MPTYIFACEDCGPFDVVREMAAAAAPAPCPSCREPGRRIFTPPGVRRVEAPLRRVREVEERSAHEPRVVREKVGRPMPHHHRHAPAPPWVLGHGH